jgi:hypothetical protein
MNAAFQAMFPVLFAVALAIVFAAGFAIAFVVVLQRFSAVVNTPDPFWKKYKSAI